METGLNGFLAFVNDLTEEEMLGAIDADGWNVRDHLTHLAVWAEGIAALMRRENRWEAMGLDIPEPDGEPDYDALNAAIRAQHTHMSGAEARAWVVKAHETVAAEVESLSDNELGLPYERYVAPFTGDLGEPIAEYILGNTEDHYDEHTPWMRAILDPGSRPFSP
jgi:hypothetical protein